MLALDTTTLVSTIALVVAVAAVVISGLAHRQSKLLIGRRKPIVISAPKEVDPYGGLDAPPPRDDAAVRIAVVYMFNQSSVPQRLVIDLDRTQLLKPVLGSEQPHALARSIDFAPHSGGNVSLAIVYPRAGWPSDIAERRWTSGTPYQVRIVGLTQSGHEANWTGCIDLFDPFWRG